MPVNPYDLDYFRRGAPIRVLPGKVTNGSLDYFRRGEVLPGGISPLGSGLTSVVSSVSYTWTVDGRISSSKSYTWNVYAKFEKLVPSLNVSQIEHPATSTTGVTVTADLVTMDTSVNANPHTYTTEQWDIWESSASVKVTPPSNWAAATGYTAFWSMLRPDQNTPVPETGSAAPFEMGIENDNLLMGSEAITGSGSVPYDPVDHAYWRIRQDSSGVYHHDTSPDGVTWTQHTSQSTSGWAYTRYPARMWMHVTSSGGTAPSGPTYFSKINLYPVISSKSYTWNVAPTTTAVTSSVSYTWNVNQAVVSPTSYTWTVLQQLQSSMSYSWYVLAAVVNSQPYSWQVLGANSSSVAYSFLVNSEVTSSKAYTWNVNQAVLSSMSYTWSIFSSAHQATHLVEYPIAIVTDSSYSVEVESPDYQIVLDEHDYQAARP